MYEYMKTWRLKAKSAIYKAFGNKCGICGYDKCTNAFDLHHLDESEKNANVSSLIVRGSKCVCLCSNCHREVHAGVTEIPEDIARFDETLLTEDDIPVRSEKKYDSCPVCGKQKWEKQQFCSNECLGLSRRKMNVSEQELRKLIWEDKLSYVEIGKMFGVSDNAIRKRAKKLGIELRKVKKQIKLYKWFK